MSSWDKITPEQLNAFTEALTMTLRKISKEIQKRLDYLDGALKR